MSYQVPGERKPPTPDEINKLRDELHSLKSERPDILDDEIIKEILLLPPTLFFEAVRSLTLAFGPLSTFPIPEHQPAAITPNSKPLPRRPNPVVDDGASFLEDALDALTSYNKLLEEKVAKFTIQSDRSLATLRESSDSGHDVTAVSETADATKLRNEQRMLQIDSMKKSFDAHDKNNCLKLEEYDTAFWRDILFLSSQEFFNSSHPTPSADTPLWSEYDYILQHIQRWRHLVNFHSSHQDEATVDHAQQLVNALIYTITRHCQVQLAIVFHENLVSKTKRGARQKAVHDEAVDIAKEIDWLWEEVIPVAHMSASAQFLRPITKLYENWESSKNLRMAIVTTYASGALSFMNDRLSAVAERTKTLVHHHQALYNTARLRQQEESSSSEGMVPGRAPHTPAQRSRPGPEQATAAEHVRSFMQLYGVVPIHGDDPSPKPTPSLLDGYVRNRAHKGDTLLQDLHDLFEAAAKAGLTDRELGGELLLESLLADSAARPADSGSVYKDIQLEGSIEVLRDQAAQIQEIFRDLKLEGPTSPPDYVAHAYQRIADRHATKGGQGRFKGGQSPNADSVNSIRDPKFEEFVRKWGS
ncbi:hypothetical protein F5Y12DRAFT_739379 [Xylaria sp. FL1777]|nr:hypothetical protein F5Y12DRAFT_739379 [Xylaria sp. FL1777]